MAESYSEAFAAMDSELPIQQAAVTAERAQAGVLLEELSAMPQARRLLMVANSSRFALVSLCQALERESRKKGFSCADEAVNLARVATQVATRLDTDTYGAATVHDVEARCWSQLGNAYRISGDFVSASAAFDHAEDALKKGSADPLELAWFLDLLATFRRFQNRLEEGQKYQEKAIHLYQEIGDGHMEGRALIKLATFHQLNDEPSLTKRCLGQGLGLIEVDREPFLVVSASHTLACALLDEGSYREARLALQRAKQGLDHLEDHQISYLRIKWVEARIDEALGRLEKAESSFKLVRQGFIRLGLGFEVAQVSLDLAHLYARRQRTTEMKTIVGEMLPIFEAQELHEEATAALLLLRHAVETERATLRLVQEVRSYLDKAQTDPQLKFRPSVAI